jgi:RNA polymerase sigma factor (sigma-70 family)
LDPFGQIGIWTTGIWTTPPLPRGSRPRADARGQRDEAHTADESYDAEAATGRWDVAGVFHQLKPIRDRPVELSTLGRRAAAGERRAWPELVGQMDAVLQTVARRYRLGPADVDDVVQTTWLRAVEHVAGLNDPGAIAGWLVVTARREAMRTLQRGVREVLIDDIGAIDDVDPVNPELVAIEGERRAALHRAVRRLSGRQRRLATSMLASPEPNYERLSWLLDMPIGSIGPTRKRALARLRDDANLVQAISS